ncbi:MAG: ATP-binding protein, partial [Methanomicrobium sp.]|nr:ATP-binding protein [Methanomicrobium sp.]
MVNNDKNPDINQNEPDSKDLLVSGPEKGSMSGSDTASSEPIDSPSAESRAEDTPVVTIHEEADNNEAADTEENKKPLLKLEELELDKIETSSDIEVPKRLIDQVIGQEHAVEVIKKAATQRRHVMMIGTPGTGKSMLAKAMAELLPKEDLQDILVYPNSDDSNTPIIRT